MGTIHPISPIKSFNVAELGKALLYFSKGTHIGKIVVNYDTEISFAPMLNAPPRAKFDGKATYVIVGGLGGLGRSIVEWMVDYGARNLAIFNRSGYSPKEASILIAELEKQRISVKIHKCDVANMSSVQRAFREVAIHGTIKGIMHAAVVLEDKLFTNLSYAEWMHGLYAKVQGSLNLHNVASDMNLCLDFFLMTSSFEAVMALPTQAAYCAANCFQDAFARYRRSLGLPGCAIAFGLITEIGEMGQREKTRQMIYRNGLYRTGEMGFLRMLESAFLHCPSPTSKNMHFDPMAEAQLTTCLEPGELAKMAGKHYDAATQQPRWHSDKKFSHIFQSMNDHISGRAEASAPSQGSLPAITTAMDAAIQAGLYDEAVQIVTTAIVERIAALLFRSQDGIDASRSVAHYGVDSLIAVELRNWFTVLFQDTVPLLMILDERISIMQLGETVVEKRGVYLHSV